MKQKELFSTLLKPDTTSVGNRIKQIRQSLNISMAEFALRIDKNAKSGTVSNWETGKNLPNKKRLEKIAELGNITISELLYGIQEEFIEFIINVSISMRNYESHYGYSDFKSLNTDELIKLYDDRFLVIADIFNHKLQEKISDYELSPNAIIEDKNEVFMVQKKELINLFYKEYKIYGGDFNSIEDSINIIAHICDLLVNDESHTNVGIINLSTSKLRDVLTSLEKYALDETDRKKTVGDIDFSLYTMITDIINKSIDDIEQLE